jgi:hypothetical protein
MTNTHGWVAASATAVALVVVAVAGCSASNSNAKSSSTAGRGGATGAGVAADGAPPAAGQATSGRGGSGQAATSRTASALARAALQGDVVYTADVSVSAPDVGAAVQQAREIVEGAGGYVLDSSSSADGSGHAEVTFKVPPGSFQKVLDDVQANVRSVTSVRQQADDVTDQVVDVKSRLSVQQASVDRVQRYLDQAKSLTEMVQLEAELTRRQADLESLEAQLAALKGRVDLATLTLHISKAAAPTAPTHRQGGFLGGLRAGWHAFAGAATAALVVLGAVLPFAVLALVGLAGWQVVRRRVAATRRVFPSP